MYALSWADVQRNNRHIRVDVIYTKLSERKKLIIDVIGIGLFFLPLGVFLVRASIGWTIDSWVWGERFMESTWYPPSAPFRAMLAIGYTLLLIQASADFIRDVYRLIEGKP